MRRGTYSTGSGSSKIPYARNGSAIPYLPFFFRMRLVLTSLFITLNIPKTFRGIVTAYLLQSVLEVYIPTCKGNRCGLFRINKIMLVALNDLL